MNKVECKPGKFRVKDEQRQNIKLPIASTKSDNSLYRSSESITAPQRRRPNASLSRLVRPLPPSEETAVLVSLINKRKAASGNASDSLEAGLDGKEHERMPQGQDKRNRQSASIAVNLEDSLEDRIGCQQDWLRLFSQMDRSWQHRAMFWVWKAHGEPIHYEEREPFPYEYGRRAIVKSALCLLDKVGNGPEAKRAIDHLIEEIAESEKKAISLQQHYSPLSIQDAPFELSFRESGEASSCLCAPETIYPLEEAILTAEACPNDNHREIIVGPILRKTFFSRVTNIREDAPGYSDDDLSESVKKVIDSDIVKYLSDPWNYLKEALFPDRGTISATELDHGARHLLNSKNFTALNYKVIEHPDVPAWVFKGNTSQISHVCNREGNSENNRFDHLNRVKMSEIMRNVAKEENLLIGFPEIHLIDTGIETDNMEERYIVVQRKIPILSHEENVAVIKLMPYHQQRLYAEHLCRLILRTGYCGAHFRNMTLLDGKLYIFDEKAMGVLVDQSDPRPFFDRTLDECAAIGLQRMIDTIGADLPVFRVAAENALIDLREKWLYTRSHREQFHRFILAVQNPRATPEDRLALFKQLDPQLQKFLAFVTGKALDLPGGEKDGYMRILEQPEILNLISNRSGINILHQLEACLEIQSNIEVLTALKATLLDKNPIQRSLPELKSQLEVLFEDRPFFSPLAKKIESIMNDVELDLGEGAEATRLKEFCFRMLHANIPGSHQCLLDDLIGMLYVLKRDNSLHLMHWKVERAFNHSYGSVIHDPTPARAVPKDLVTAQRFSQQEATKKLNVLMVAYECAAFGLKFGGLGEAVYGMAKGLAQQGHKVTLLLPKFDKLPTSVQEQMTEVEAVSHPYAGGVKTDRLLGIEQWDISVRYLEDTPEDEMAIDRFLVSDPKRIYEDGALADPDEEWVGLKERMAYFSNAASEYIHDHGEEIDIVMFHDWHSAYAINRIAHRHFNEWSQGKTPASVFVIHNNNYGCQGIYDRKAATILPKCGDQRPGMNVMLDAMELSDQVVTVSPSFALEIQQPVLGAGIDPWMRKIAHKGKLSGIANGSNPDLWNPANNEVLKNWIDPESGEHIPLHFSPDDPDLIAKKQLIKDQLQKALEVHYPEFVKKYRINVKDKDLILYVGRYDSSQKGLEKFLAIMQAAHERAAAFIAMGVGEDEKASKILDGLEKEAETLGNAWITRGKADGFSIRMQLGDKEKGIPSLGPLLRAAAIYSAAPSSFEPCGLVQFEAWLFGALVIATATGGLADTISSNPKDPGFNGFTFERLGRWESNAQDELVYETTLKAIDYWRSLGQEEKTAIMQRVMRQAKLSSWTSAPDGLTPTQQYERVFAAAAEQAKHKRGLKPIDLIGMNDPLPVVKDHYFGQGRQEKLYKTYGAHLVREKNRVVGVRFQVMAPGAKFVNLVIKDGIEEHLCPMENLGNGNWQLLVEGADKGTIYEYEITDVRNHVARKVDPFAFGSELRPKHASVVADCDSFEWTDDKWLERREMAAAQEKPQNIYEVHLGSWRRNSDGSFKNYRVLAHELAEHCKSLHYTHIELLGIFEHPTDSSWGYQVSGYFAPTSRHGSLEDFQYLVNYLHEQELGVILDFVPFHFCPDEWSLREFSGMSFFESTHPYHGETPGWGTRVFDLSREDVRNFLLSSAHFFLSNHIDGIRVDAVSKVITHLSTHRYWVPNEEEGTHWNYGGLKLMRSLNQMAHSQFPGVLTHAENTRPISRTKVDTDSIEMDGLGFDRRWNITSMQKSMQMLKADPQSRTNDFNELIKAFEEHWQMKNVASVSHDEVVYGKGSLYEKGRGSKSEKLAQVRLHRSLQTLFPADGQLTFMGTEFAQPSEWNFNAELEWAALQDDGHRGVLEMNRDINAFYLSYPLLWSSGIAFSGFEWISIDRDNCVISYHRKDASGKQLAVIHNFSDQPLTDYPILFSQCEEMSNLSGMKVVFNTDLDRYGGTGKFDDIDQAQLIEGQDSNPKGFCISLPAFSTMVLEESFDRKANPTSVG